MNTSKPDGNTFCFCLGDKSLAFAVNCFLVATPFGLQEATSIGQVWMRVLSPRMSLRTLDIRQSSASRTRLRQLQ